MSQRYKAYNGPMPTTAALPAVTTGTTIKTMLQIATPSTKQIQVISWGFSLDDPPGADSVIELIEVDVGATITQYVATGLTKMDPNQPNSLMDISSTSKSGYTASVEGTVAASRLLDVISMSSVSAEAAPVLTWAYQFMPDERPIVAASKFLRIRATTPTTAVDMRCWVVWDE